MIGQWAKSFLGYKTNMDEFQIQELFNDKINEYLETDEESVGFDTVDIADAEDVEEYEDDTEEANIGIAGEGNLDILLKIVLLSYKKSKHATGFTAPFDFNKYIEGLPYVDANGTSTYKINGKKVKTFIDEYVKDCDNNDKDYKSDWEVFADYLLSRGTKNPQKTEQSIKTEIKSKWPYILERIEIIEKMDAIMTNCKIGLIEVKGFKPADSQKIFNIINSEGVKLTAAEILSAKTYWNNIITNPSQEMFDAAEELYKNMNIKISEVYRWDIPATLLSRMGDNVVFKTLSWDSAGKKAEFEKKLTLGFKIFAGIYEKGIKKEDIDNMGKNTNINWNQAEQTISEIKNVLKLIGDADYFQFLKSWDTTIMELTSDAIALDFFLILYFDWKRKGSPMGSNTKAKQFQKNCFILWDQLIYEYVNKQWRGSSDSLIANNIKKIDNETAVFTPIDTDKWKKLLKEIRDTSTVNDNDVSVAVMKPILYHMYCLKEIQGPGSVITSIEVDHIIPQSAFKSSALNRKEVIQDNLYNLGLLPKKDNISKSNNKLKQIDDSWLKSQIKKYEFIDETQYDKFSNVSNYEELFDFKKTAYDDAFENKREELLNN